MFKTSCMSRRTLPIVLLLLIASACRPWMPRSAPRFGSLRVDRPPFLFEHDIRLFKINGSMTVVLLPDRGTNLVSVDARYDFGAAADPHGRAGLAHLMEHLTFQARTGADRTSLGGRMAEVALTYNAFTNHDVTHYTATAFTDRLPDLIELEAQRLEATCDQIDDDAFRREQDVVLEEEAERRTPWSELFLDLSREVWGKGHPYARDVNGREVAVVTRDEVCRFLEDHYTPGRLSLVITGDFDAPRIASALSARFGRIGPRSTAPPAPVADARLAGTRSRHRAPSTTRPRSSSSLRPPGEARTPPCTCCRWRGCAGCWPSLTSSMTGSRAPRPPPWARGGLGRWPSCSRSTTQGASTRPWMSS